LTDIDKAIAIAPWIRSNLATRRDIQTHAKIAPRIVERHYVKGLRALAQFNARTGSDATALRAFIEAFRIAAAQGPDPEMTPELEGLTRDFSAFLVERFRREEAAQWWLAFAGNPLASEREKHLAAAEAQRIADER
jgi:hypothetical protein